MSTIGSRENNNFQYFPDKFPILCLKPNGVWNISEEDHLQCVWRLRKIETTENENSTKCVSQVNQLMEVGKNYEGGVHMLRSVVTSYRPLDWESSRSFPSDFNLYFGIFFIYCNNCIIISFFNNICLHFFSKYKSIS